MSASSTPQHTTQAIPARQVMSPGGSDAVRSTAANQEEPVSARTRSRSRMDSQVASSENSADNLTAKADEEEEEVERQTSLSDREDRDDGRSQSSSEASQAQSQDQLHRFLAGAPARRRYSITASEPGFARSWGENVARPIGPASHRLRDAQDYGSSQQATQQRINLDAGREDRPGFIGNRGPGLAGEGLYMDSVSRTAPPVKVAEAYSAEVDNIDSSSSRIEKLKGLSNWSNWKTNIRFKLIEKDLDEVVYEDRPESVPEDTWNRKAKRAAAIIGMHIERTQQALVPNIGNMTGKEIMEAYKKLYDTNDQASQLSKKFAFLQMTMKSDEDVITWVSRVEHAAADCREAGLDVKSDQISVLLNGLTDHFAVIKTIILTSSSSLDVVDVTQKLINFEAANKVSIKDAQVALAASHQQHQRPGAGKKSKSSHKARGSCKSCGRDGCICYWCQKANHHSHDCRAKAAGQPKTPKKGKEQLKEAPKKNNFDSGKNQRNQQRDSPSGTEGHSAEDMETILHAEEIHHAGTSTKRWLLDSGATCHMVADKRWFIALEQIEPIRIIFGGPDVTAEARAKGTVRIHLYVEGKLKKVVFNDVLYVPEARHHLISTSALVEKGASILFKDKLAKASVGDRAVLEARNSGKLWELEVAPEVMQVYSAEAETESDLWHQRLGHVSTYSLEETLKLHEIDPPEQINVEQCRGCMLGKSVKSPFKTSEHRATKPFEMLHSDICGPFKDPSTSGSRFFAIIVDDYTKYVKVQPIVHKDAARTVLQNYITAIHQQTSHRVQTVRTDNDAVYCGGDAEDWFTVKGIHHQRTVPYSPQSNGVAERNIRTVKEMAGAMMHNAKYKFNLDDPPLWGEAVKHAADILNNTVKKEILTTPHHKLWNQLKDIGTYRIWGCPAWIHLDPAQRKGGTWAPKREMGYHVGMAEGTKGYRIYFPNKVTAWKFSSARDVIFEEKRPSRPSQATYAPNALLSENLGEGTHPFVLPQTYSQAINSRDSHRWLQAMQEEIDSIESKGTYVLSDLPPGRKAVGCRWVFTLKPAVGETPARFKARLVAQGFSQMPGLDYSETFAPVARYSSLRVFLAIAASRNLELVQADVVTAFLNGSLEEEIYMKQPPGYTDPEAPHQVWKLIKSLYGLKQAGRVWIDKLREALTKLDFVPLYGDDCIYRNKEKNTFIITYVDDMLVASTHNALAYGYLKKLEAEFKLKVLGPPKRFLGLNIERDLPSRTISLDLEQYSAKVLGLMSMENANPVSTPMTPNVKLQPVKESSVDVNLYQRCIGSLMFMVTTMRPDIAFAVGSLAMFASKPGKAHFSELKHLLRYIRGTKSMRLVLGGSSLELQGFTDASYADNWNARSSEGYIFYLGKYPVTWAAKKQKIVTLSTTEAEYVAITESIKEAVWLKVLVKGFGKAPGIIQIHVDNRSSLALAHNPEFHNRTKHINVRHHFIREMILRKEVELTWIASNDNPADVMTKSLPRERVQAMRRLLELTLGGSVGTKDKQGEPSELASNKRPRLRH